MDKVKHMALSMLGAALCVAPPAGVTLMYFPLWIETSSSATISGLSLILILLSIFPLFRILKNNIATPSAPVIWILVCLFSFAFKSIIDQVLVISFVGSVSSVAGMIVFWVRDKDTKKE